jgi:hypothetical protein
MIGTKEAAKILGISHSRLCMLLRQDRVPGAKKIGRIWMIPLKNGRLKIIRKGKGPAGKWMKGKLKVQPQRKSTGQATGRRRTKKTINVNTHHIRYNNKKQNTCKKPVIRVKIGSKKTFYTNYIEVNGPCRLLYEPEKPCVGAQVWLETFAEVKFEPAPVAIRENRTQKN